MRFNRLLLGLGMIAIPAVIAGCGMFYDLFPDLAPLQWIQVHDYTNVTLHPGHLLIAEGTPGARLISYTGRIGLGKGGSDQYPLDDTWTDGQFTSDPEEHAEAFDRLYFQIWHPATATFDLGVLCSSIYISLSQDHGPYPEEGLEYRVAVSTDGIDFFTLPTDTPITIFRRGWSAAGEALITGEVLPDSEPSGQASEGQGHWADVLNDDWSARWDLADPIRYVRLSPLSSREPYSEPEIDAMTCVKEAARLSEEIRVVWLEDPDPYDGRTCDARARGCPQPEYRQVYEIEYIVVHATASSSTNSALREFWNRSDKSTHYLISNGDGELMLGDRTITYEEGQIIQMVDDKDTAWTIGIWPIKSVGEHRGPIHHFNSINIELVGDPNQSGWVADKMYFSLAKLVKELSRTHGIDLSISNPDRRSGAKYILGHDEAGLLADPDLIKGDPCGEDKTRCTFDWDRLMKLVRGP